MSFEHQRKSAESLIEYPAIATFGLRIGNREIWRWPYKRKHKAPKTGNQNYCKLIHRADLLRRPARSRSPINLINDAFTSHDCVAIPWMIPLWHKYRSESYYGVSKCNQIIKYENQITIMSNFWAWWMNNKKIINFF